MVRAGELAQDQGDDAMTDRSQKLQAAIDAQTTDDAKSLAYTRFVLAELLEENLKLKEMLVEQNNAEVSGKEA